MLKLALAAAIMLTSSGSNSFYLADAWAGPLFHVGIQIQLQVEFFSWMMGPATSLSSDRSLTSDALSSIRHAPSGVG